jgi:hypothetical protein
MEKKDRQIAVDCFNETWTLMDKKNRTIEEDFRMLHLAHSSCYHWSLCGTALEISRGEWQISRVNTVLGYGEAALRHAQRCLDLCIDNKIGDWDLAFAYEALSRAYLTLNDLESMNTFKLKALKASESIKDKEDLDFTLDALKDLHE